MMDNQGLYPKYDVRKTSTGESVEGCFVLVPHKDYHALVALRAYAESCREDNPALAYDLTEWLNAIDPTE